MEHMNSVMAQTSQSNCLNNEIDSVTYFLQKNPELNKALRPHQRTGSTKIFQQLAGATEASLGPPITNQATQSSGNGCVLADLPGSGKCLTTLVVWWTLLTQNLTEPSTLLILCPKTIISHWKAEERKWRRLLNANDKDCHKVYSLEDAITNFEAAKNITRWGNRGGLLVCSYNKWHSMLQELETKGRGALRWKKLLLNPGPTFLVLDEFHLLRNNRILSKSVQTFYTNRRLGITGTLCQNSLVDVYNLVKIVNQSAFNSRKEFEAEFVEPVTRGLHPKASWSSKQLMLLRMIQLSTVLDRFVLRCKRVADVAEITHYLIFLQPSKEQIEAYYNIIKEISVPGDPEFASSNTLFDLLWKARSTILRSKTDIREIDNIRHLHKTNAKFTIMLDILGAAFENNEKVVIFVTKLTTISEMRNIIHQRFSNSVCVELCGSMKDKDRKHSVDRLNNNKNVRVLISTYGCGAEGISLVGANIVILFDSDWNPFKEFQAVSRVNRVGQLKKIHVFSLIFDNSIEKLLLIYKIKKLLIAKMLDGEKEIPSFANLNIMDSLRTNFLSYHKDGIHHLVNAKPSLLTQNVYIHRIFSSSKEFLSQIPVEMKTFISTHVASTPEDIMLIKDKLWNTNEWQEIDNLILRNNEVVPVKRKLRSLHSIDVAGTYIDKSTGLTFLTCPGELFCIEVDHNSKSMVLELANGLSGTFQIPDDILCWQPVGQLSITPAAKMKIESQKLAYLDKAGFQKVMDATLTPT